MKFARLGGSPRSSVSLDVGRRDMSLAVRDQVGVGRYAVQAWLDHAPDTPADRARRLGVDYLDRFRQTQVRSEHASRYAWMLCRYAELATGFVFYQLAPARVPALHPQPTPTARTREDIESEPGTPEQRLTCEQLW
jgi:hypothetical protein